MIPPREELLPPPGLSQNAVRAVVLSGGAAHGAYEVGVLKALMTGASWTTGNVPLDPDIITGTSIGAYNGAVLTSRLEVEDSAATIKYLEDVWTNVIPRGSDGAPNQVYRFRGNPGELLHPGEVVRHPARTAAAFGRDAAFLAQDLLRRGMNFFSTSGGLLQRSLGLVDLSTFISRDPAESLFRNTVVLENLRRSRRSLFLVATDWRTGQQALFHNQDMTDAIGMQVIFASSALPGIFPAVSIGNNIYVDGGLSLNTPLAPAFLMATPGADTAHVIYLDPMLADIPVQPLQSTIATMDRLTTLILSRSVESDMRIASRVNRGLQLVAQAAQGDLAATRAAATRGPVPEQAAAVVETASLLIDGIAGKLPDSPKTIHRYRPSRYLGGTLSLLDFSRNHMLELIDLGFKDVMNHDCHTSACVLPQGPLIEAIGRGM
jgi:predicted acylesterase/phospholipase RssA